MKSSGRNWVLIIGVGCLAVVCACVVFVGGIFAVVFATIRSTDVYQQALQTAQSDPRVIEALGEPVEAGFMVSGSVRMNAGEGGTADLSIPISGPNGSGTVYAVATSSGGVWTFSTLEVEIAGQPGRIDLLGR